MCEQLCVQVLKIEIGGMIVSVWMLINWGDNIKLK